jgi:signal transduction histidine kinase
MNLWRPFTGLLLALVLGVASLQDAAAGRGRLPIALAVCAAIVAAWALTHLRPHPAWPVLMGVGALGLTWIGASTASDVAIAVAVITLARRLPEIAGAVVSLLMVAGAVAIYDLHWGQHDLTTVLYNSLGISALYALVVTLSRLQAEQQRTRAALEELRRSREAQVEAARGAERIRLAREIHDVLGHTLSALAVQLEGARLLLEREGAAPAAVEAVGRSHRLAREGLDEARRAVGTLRGDDLPGPDLLPGLVEGFSRDSGTEARLEVEGEPADLAPDARLALYRTAQEALTNVRRHARAEHVDLRLRWEAGGAELTVENDGVAPHPEAARPGYGLAGMRERAELLGGRLELAAEDGRFRVRLWVPTAAAIE